MKKNNLWIFLIVVIIVIIGAYFLINNKQQTTVKEDAAKYDIIKIGIFEPMTGAMAAGGELEMQGFRLAHEQRPNVLAKKVELVLVDNKSDKVEAANAVSKLIEKDDVVAVLGSYSSGLSIPGGEIANKAGIPMLTATATNPLVTLGKNYVFRDCFIDPFQGNVLAKYTYENLGISKAALLVDVAQDYSVGLASFYKRTFEDMGGKIVADLKYQTGDQDFSAQLSQIINSEAEALFFPGYFGDVALIAIQGRELGFRGVYMGGDTLDNPTLLELAGEHAEGLKATSFYHKDAPAASDVSIKFIDSFTKKYQEDPNAVSVMTYDAYNLLLDAIEKAGSTEPDAIKDALTTTEEFIGAGGTITIDENGDAIRPAVVLEVVNGQFEYEATVNP